MLYTRGVGQQRSCWLALCNAVDATPENLPRCHGVGLGMGMGWRVGQHVHADFPTRLMATLEIFRNPHDIPKHSFGAIKPMQITKNDGNTKAHETQCCKRAWRCGETMMCLKHK